MSALVAAAAVTLSGTAAATLAGVRGALRAALALLLGLGIWSAGYAAALFAFGAHPRVRLAKDVLLAVAGLAVLWIERRRASLPRQARPPDGEPRWLGPAALAAAALATAFFVEHTLRHPDGGWDAWALWNLRARFLARAGGGFQAAFSPEMLFWAHVDYPLLVPGVVAQGFLLAAGEPVWVPAIASYAFAALSVALSWAALRELRGPGWAALAALVLLATPCFVGFAANQQADVPVSAFLLAACALAALALESRQPRFLAAAGFAASLAAWTKNEGALYLMSLGTALLLTRWAPLRERLSGLLRFGAGALPVLALAAWFKLRVAHANDLLSDAAPARLLDLRAWGQLAAALLRRIVYFQDWALWLVAWAFVLALLLPRLPRRPAARAAGTAVALAFAAMLPIYVLQPHPLLWFFRASIDRLLIQLWPSALLATVLALADAPRPAAAAGKPSSGASADAAGASPSPQTRANDR